MQVKRQTKQRSKPLFEAFDIVIKIESAKEARGLYALFNRTHNLVVLPREMPEKIRNAIGQEHYTDGQITEEVSYGDYYYPGYPKQPW